MTAVSASTRSAQAMSRVPESIQENSFTTISFSAPKPILTKTKTEKGRRDQQSRTGDDLRGTGADDAAEEAGDRRRDQRQEDDELDGEIHDERAPSPSSH
jgi:hypothetical protein